jgi:hypothetical protein
MQARNSRPGSLFRVLVIGSLKMQHENVGIKGGIRSIGANTRSAQNKKNENHAKETTRTKEDFSHARVIIPTKSAQ